MPLIVGSFLMILLQTFGIVDSTPIIKGITVASFVGGVILAAVHLALMLTVAD